MKQSLISLAFILGFSVSGFAADSNLIPIDTETVFKHWVSGQMLAGDREQGFSYSILSVDLGKSWYVTYESLLEAKNFQNLSQEEQNGIINHTRIIPPLLSFAPLERFEAFHSSIDEIKVFSGLLLAAKRGEYEVISNEDYVDFIGRVWVKRYYFKTNIVIQTSKYPNATPEEISAALNLLPKKLEISLNEHPSFAVPLKIDNEQDAPESIKVKLAAIFSKDISTEEQVKELWDLFFEVGRSNEFGANKSKVRTLVAILRNIPSRLGHKVSIKTCFDSSLKLFWHSDDVALTMDGNKVCIPLVDNILDAFEVPYVFKTLKLSQRSSYGVGFEGLASSLSPSYLKPNVVFLGTENCQESCLNEDIINCRRQHCFALKFSCGHQKSFDELERDFNDKQGAIFVDDSESGITKLWDKYRFQCQECSRGIATQNSWKVFDNQELEDEMRVSTAMLLFQQSIPMGMGRF